MATALSNINCRASLSATLSETIETVARSAAAGAGVNLAFTDGTTVNKADQFFQDVARTITSGNNEDLDLFDLATFDVQTDLLKNTITFADIVGLLIVNAATSVGNLVVGNNNTTAAWVGLLDGDNQSLTLPPDSFIMAATRTDPGFAVADTTSHLLRCAASGGNVTYAAYLLGRSA